MKILTNRNKVIWGTMRSQYQLNRASSFSLPILNDHQTLISHLRANHMFHINLINQSASGTVHTITHTHTFTACWVAIPGRVCGSLQNQQFDKKKIHSTHLTTQIELPNAVCLSFYLSLSPSIYLALSFSINQPLFLPKTQQCLVSRELATALRI